MPRGVVRSGLVAGLLGMAVAASLAGCGGWDAPSPDEVPLRAESGDAPTPGPLPTPVPLPTPTSEGGGGSSGSENSGDAVHAGDFVLTSFPEIADFGEQQSTAADFTEFSEEDFAACLRVPVELVEDRSIESAYGPLLYDGLSEFSLTSTASVVSEDTLASDRDVILLPEYPRCFAEAAANLILADALAQAGEGSGLSVDIQTAEFAPTPSGATARITTVISMTYPDGTVVDIYYDVVPVLEGRVEAAVHVSGGEPFPEDVVAAAVAQVVDKVDHQ